MNYLTEFDLDIKIVLIVYMFFAKILFLKVENKIVKSRDAQRGITNKKGLRQISKTKLTHPLNFFFARRVIYFWEKIDWSDQKQPQRQKW